MTLRTGHLTVLAAIAALLALPAVASAREWLAGDLHVHTCLSHDVFCLGEEVNEKIYTAGFTVGQRFVEARLRGLDYLAITDHDSTDSARDLDFGSQGVIGVPGYENSIRGHAQVLGSTELLPTGDKSATAINAMVDTLHARGGVFQANHVGYTPTERFQTCADTGNLHWKYGFAVQPDVIEVWNPTSFMVTAERYLECWLERGARVGVTAGSDSHWISIAALQGVGNPTTWVNSDDRSSVGVLRGLREGRTTLSRLAPGQGGGKLLLEADADGDGTYESGIGDTIPAGSWMRIRVEGALTGLATVRANGETLFDLEPLTAAMPVRFRAPSEAGWVRATLQSTPVEGNDEFEPCRPYDQPASTCPYDHQMAALTSPIWVEGAAPAVAGTAAKTQRVRRSRR